ncbi:MAG TPA: radical SAM protein [Thermoanaerobaculia bacterium]|nr:radical SAM protein [Thermoanaerobaculia bacterium]
MSVIEQGSYSDFSRIIHDSVNAHRVPVNGTIEVTRRCPLECAHCYNNLPMDDLAARNGELTTEEHKRLIDELAEMGLLWLCYSGGEIFARRDFMEIYAYAKSRGMLVTLFTNGTLVTERIADALAANPPFTIEITLYGRSKEVYEGLTGVPGSWEKCMRGIELILERGLPLKLKTVAVSINVHEIAAMREFAESLGVEFKFDPMINPRIDCSASPLAVRLSETQIVALDLQDPERVAEWRRLARDFAPPVPESPQLYECGGGVNSFAIDPNGELSICVLSHVDTYNVRTGFREGWEKFLLGVRTRPASRVTKCTNCALRSLCGQCAANGELENGDPEMPVDFLCRTAHLRAEVFGIDVRPHGDCEYCIGGSHRDAIDHMAAEAMARAGEAIEQIKFAPLPAGTAASCGSGGCNGCTLTTANIG